ncbi:MAG: LacI family transcriptional regulator [Spirochaetaceae bacterium]|nr:MAG: LacI family transcriptional regulator [Spirochaetaceae bacterium]
MAERDKPRAVTVYDVAHRLDLSPSTVSRVLNNSLLISSEKSDLILRTAAEMGYVKRTIRRHAARSILNIALFLPIAPEAQIHLFYDFAELIVSIKAGFGNTRANIVTVPVGCAEEVIGQKKIGGIDGCIFAFSEPDPAFTAVCRAKDIPIVLLNRTDPELDFVTADNEGGVVRLVEHANRVYGSAIRPAFVSFPVMSHVSAVRERGFNVGCERIGVAGADRRVYPIYDLREVPGLLEAATVDERNVIVCFNDILAVSLYQAALHRGVRIPEDFGVTGFDNSPVAGLLDKKITTVDLAVAELGRRAATWLRERIIERSQVRLADTVPGRLVVGETVGSRRE